MIEKENVQTSYLFLLFIYFFKYEIYCQIGFHTTPSAHPNRFPPQRPSPTFRSLLPVINPHSVSSQFLRVSYGLPPSLSNFFSPSLPPWSSVKFLRIHIRVKTYGICLSLYDLFHRSEERRVGKECRL